MTRYVRRFASVLVTVVLSTLAVGCGSEDPVAGDTRDAGVEAGADTAADGPKTVSDSGIDAEPDAPGDAALAELTPRLGVNFTHFHAALDGNGILASYDKPGIRALVQSQLAATRANGARTTRLLIWHTGDIGTNAWGVIPYQHAQGVLSEPYDSNLRNYLTDVKDAGFTRLTVAFGPAGLNDPKENYGATCNATFFDASLQSPYLEENWSFIKYVRSVVKQLGPPDSRFDLLNEGAPYAWIDGNCAAGKSVKAQLQNYDKLIYARYTQEFGDADVTISLMASNLLTCKLDSGGSASFDVATLVSEIDDLVDVFAGQPPKWFAVHEYFPEDPSCAAIEHHAFAAALLVIDNVLAGKALPQPLVIQETYHDDAKVAAGVAQFMNQSSRPIDELIEWPLTSDSPTPDMNVEPPYTLTSYLPLQK